MGTEKTQEKAILVGICVGRASLESAQDHLAELRRLAETAEASVVQEFLQRMARPNASTLIGEGKIAEVAEAAERLEAGLVVFDAELSGSQVRNLEKSLPGIKVLDRTGLILDIFAKHAVTAESRLMVEIAQMQYMMPRLTKAWAHLSRQVAGSPGIGMRGPGEKQLEVDRRLVRLRIQDLKRKLKKIERDRESRGQKRESVFHIGVVGYTNAGKSTLVNRLSGAGLLERDQLFATLDSTTRRIYLLGENGTGENAIVSDTVGFIRKLPHHLVETFRSTLAVAGEADCILEVADGAARDVSEHIAVTSATIQDLVDAQTPRILAFNKVDAMPPETREALAEAHPDAVFVSARTGEGMESLKERLAQVRDAWSEARTAKRKAEEVPQEVVFR
jgi:GTP-binding protein HflX